jgi:hypothetical protein
MLIGLSAKNAILIVEYAKELYEEGRSVFDAAFEASRLRFRPIMMTAISSNLGNIPLVAAVLFFLLAASGYAPELRPCWYALEIGSITLLLLCCVAATLSFIFQSQRIHLDTIFAAVMAYLLIALIFAQIYALLMIGEPASFKFPSSAVMDSDNVFRSDLVYFSLVTIATLGYGDIVPQMGLAKMLVVVEAVLGQFYVAVLVAWLVGMLISQSLRPGHPKDK